MAFPQYHQICDGGDSENSGAAIPIYGRLLGRWYGLTRAQTEALRARYGELAPALKKALRELHPEALAEVEERQPGTRSVRPDQFSGLYLYIVSDCHVIEALPELLTLEERLRVAISFAEEHPNSPLPNVARDTWIFHSRDHLPSDRERFLEVCRGDQREILGLILRLLREQRFEPLMKSDFEQRYQQGLAAAPPASLPGDPFAESAVADQADVRIPFTPSARQRVRDLAQRFLQTVPPEQWQHASY